MNEPDFPASVCLVSIPIQHEKDVVTCRQCAKQLASWFGLSQLEQIRVATSVSELARNVYQYAGSGELRCSLHANAKGLLDMLHFEVVDRGQGITNIEQILAGSYVSQTGMGVGLRGAQRLMDEFEIDTSPKGTLIRVGKRVHPPRAFPDAKALRGFQGELRQEAPNDPLVELKVQRAELLLTTSELQIKVQELEATSLELESTNKGVVALYSELEKTAHELKEVSESKSRFFSNMTHEFRTPINIVENISKLLLSGADGALNPEQLKQVAFISDAAVELSELVNELLDLAQAQSGRMQVVAAPFQLLGFVDQLRQFITAFAMTYPNVTWEIVTPLEELALNTDRSRLFQILRNLIGNAFKYTPQGHVRIQTFRPDAEHLEFMVEDTGVGIAAENLAHVFEEFARIRTPGLTHIQGTGLGLPLAQKLAVLLKGDITLTSEPAKGSRFMLRIPCEYSRQQPTEALLDLHDTTILLIDDTAADRYLVAHILKPFDPMIIEAETGLACIDKLHSVHPDIIFLDLELPDINGDDLLESMDWSMHSRVIINTAKRLTDEERARLEPQCHAILDKSDPAYAELVIEQVQRLLEGFSR